MKNINRNPKLKKARTMQSRAERTSGTVPFQSKQWLLQKDHSEKKVLTQFKVAIKKRTKVEKEKKAAKKKK